MRSTKMFGYLDTDKIQGAQPLAWDNGIVPCSECYIIGDAANPIGSHKQHLCADHQILLDRLIRGSITSEHMEWAVQK